MKTTTSQNKILKAGTGYVIGNYLLKGITFLSAPIFTRLLTPEEYGFFGTYMSYESIFFIIIGLALHVSINNAKYEYQDKLDEYVSSIVLLTGISSLIWLVLANVFYDNYCNILDFSRFVVNILVFNCFATAMFQIFSTYVSLNYSVKSFLKITSVNAISNLGLSVILLLTVFSKSRLLGRIIGMVLPLLFISIYIIIYFFRKSKAKVNKTYWKFAFVYSIPLIPHGISQVILGSFDRIMIKNMIGAAEAGLYNFAFAISALVKVTSSSLENIWKPWIYEKMNEKDYVSIKKQGTKYAFGIALFTCLVVLVSPELIKILGAREYWASTDCVVPVVIGGYFAFIYMLPGIIEFFYGKTKYIALGTLLAAVLNIILNYLFIPKFGYIAAAYTTMVTYFLYFLFHFMLARKIHGSNIFSARQLLGICAGVVVVGFISLLIKELFVVRWIIAVALGLYSLYWVEKNFHVIKLIKDKLRK